MSTSYAPPAAYYNPTSINPSYAGASKDPRQIAENEQQAIQGTGNQLLTNDEELANQYGEKAAGTQAYLNPIESNLAQGGGGYAPSEVSQIELSPEDKQNIVTQAGITAGQGTAATVGAAERAAAAAGGSPAALATFRARASQTQDVNNANAMTNAKVAAQQAGAQGAEQVGQARINQQAQGLQYYGGLQGQQESAAQNEQGLGQGAFGTTTSGTTAASNTGVTASQTPSTFDKVLGAAGGALSALADGSPGGVSDYMANGGDGIDAVLGEDGPEVIVEHASDPVRSDTRFMADGDVPDDGGMQPVAAPSPDTPPTSWLQTYLQSSKEQQQSDAPATGALAPYTEAGRGIGKLAAHFLADGEGSEPPVAPANNAAAVAGVPAPAATTNTTWLHRYLAQKQPAAPMSAGSAPWTKSTPYAEIGSAIGGLARTAMTPRSAAPVGMPPMDPHATPATPMADGGMPSFRARPSQTPPTLVTSPTRVKLNAGDQVVPLSFRPRAKVRPSAAIPAMTGPDGRMRVKAVA